MPWKGDVVYQGAVDITGNLTVGGNLSVTGNVDIDGTLGCDDKITIDSNRIEFAAAVPTVGTYSQGDVVFNNTVVVSTTTDAGWICTTAGDMAGVGRFAPFGDTGAAIT